MHRGGAGLGGKCGVVVLGWGIRPLGITALLLASFIALPSSISVAQMCAGTIRAGRCLPGVPDSYNVLDYGAKGDGVADDAVAIQAALTAAKNAGGGSVYLPPGTFKLNNTLTIGDYVELHGTGRASVLKRADVPVNISLAGSDCSIGGGGTLASNDVIINDKYNCGNIGFSLHDFAVDGTGIASIACTSCTAGPTTSAVGIALSALTDVHVYNLYMVNMAQDGIFLKNAGVRTDVHHNHINGCNKLWGNGGCINVEMHTGAVGSGAANPGVINISDNYIVANGPDFCDLDLHVSCAADADCAGVGGVCGIGAGASNVEGINLTWASDAGGTSPIKAIVSRNRIELTDNHIGINTLGMQGGEITDNRLEAFDSGTAMKKVYAGINILGATATTVRAAQDITVSRNVILGGGVSNDRRAILVDGIETAGSARVHVHGNIVTNRALRSTLLGAIEIRSISDSSVTNNIVQNITVNHGIMVGGAALTTTDIQVTNNVITDITAGSADCIRLANTTRTGISGNTFRNCVNGIELATATIADTIIGPNFGWNSVTTKVKQTVSDATISIGETVGPTTSTFMLLPDQVIQMPNSAAQTEVLGSANQVRCTPFIPSYTINAATKIGFYVGTVGGNCGVCIYNSAGTTRIATTAGVDCTATGSLKSTTGITAFTLTAGTAYLLCWTADSTLTKLRAPSTGPSNNLFINAYVTRESTAANASVAGACPTTTGTLSAAGNTPPLVIVSVE